MISRAASQRKQRLVALGLDALSRGHWGIVAAITRLMELEGYRHV